MTWRAAWVAVVLWLCAGLASAQTSGRPSLSDQEFNIDFVTGPVLGSGRAIGLGGAYSALATGADGSPWNPAAFAARELWNTSWFTWDVTADLTADALRNVDFDNNGEQGFAYGDFSFFSLGGRVAFGAMGMGILLRAQSYQIGAAGNLDLITANYGFGYTVLQGQLVLGLAARSVLLTIKDANDDSSLVEFAGTGPEAGAVLELDGQPFRVGLAARTPVVSNRSTDTRVAASLALPNEVNLPWELQAGFAYQIGPRPLNRRFENPHEVESDLRKTLWQQRYLRMRNAGVREAKQSQETVMRFYGTPKSDSDGWSTPRSADFWREEVQLRAEEDRAIELEIEARAAARERAVEEMSRRYVLLTSEMILTGSTNNGVGLESFLSQERQDSGRRVTVGLRFGAETEPIAHWLKMRAGTYFEPSRFDNVPYRVHGTLGLDVKLFRWDLFGLLDAFELRFGSSADVAERYLKIGVGIGTWH